MKTELVLLLCYMLLFACTVWFFYRFRIGSKQNCKYDFRVAEWTDKCKPAKCVDEKALPVDDCIRYNRCDTQYGPDYTTFDTEGINEIIKTYTSPQCYEKNLCWDDYYQKCFNIRD